MEHIDEKLTRLHQYHLIINDIAEVLGYRMGQTYEPEALVKQVEKLAALKPVGDALVSYFNGETSEDNLYTVFCGWRSAISDVTPVYAELAKENYTAMATLAAVEAAEKEVNDGISG